MTAAERAFYTAQSATSDPGKFARLLDVLSADPRRVARAVSGLVVDRAVLGRRRVDHPHAQARDAEARPVRELLRRLVERDAAPLGVERAYERRVIGSCRHYALLAASIFRHHGIPARLRVGFATYFVPGFYDDHWLCEYWDAGRWRLLDAELAEEAIAKTMPSTLRRGTCRVTVSSPPARPGALCAAVRSSPEPVACRPSP